MSHHQLSPEEVAHRAGGFLPAQGLYDPAQERDACGVGLICNMDGRKSHDMIGKALQILVKLTHRGAESADNKTGDGAGLCIQIPHAFFAKVAPQAGITLPAEGDYGTGLVFLPRDEAERAVCLKAFETVVREEGQAFLGWRTLPVNSEVCGQLARASEPFMSQIFIGRREVKAGRDFDRTLYIIRKRAEKAVRESGIADHGTFYVPTLSSRTIVYKGLLKPEDFEPYFTDLLDPDVQTCLALVHQRFSTNTFPAWKLAQPFRLVCHNGEINTLRGNQNWMNARQALFASPAFGDRMRDLFPICVPGGSDSAMLDNTLELLYHSGRSLPHAMMMMVPEAWQNHLTMSDEKKAFYEYHSCLMEPWDGPALLPFTDGEVVGGLLDRNGLRPARYVVTDDGMVLLSSEVGVLDIPPEKIVKKGRLEPGRMFLIDMKAGRIVDDQEVKDQICRRQPYRAWLAKHLTDLTDLPSADESAIPDVTDLVEQQKLFGYTLEDLKIVLRPMAAKGLEAIGSMGVDTPVAVLSDRPQLLYNYFKQLFAQVTNPPLDAIREEMVTSLLTNIGYEKDLFQETPEHARLLRLKQPILTNQRLQQIKELNRPELRTAVLPTHFDLAGGGAGLQAGLDALCAAAEAAVRGGATILVLSDRGSGRERTPIPALLATAATHHHLIRAGLRTRCGLVVETAEAREVHHFCCLFGYGAGAVNPYLAYETVINQLHEGQFTGPDIKEELTEEKVVYNYVKAVSKGVLKVMSKMGVSTLQSYRGAQIFEAIGLNSTLVDAYFTGTATRIEGSGLDELAEEIRRRHAFAYPVQVVPGAQDLDAGGVYQWRRRGEHHLLNPLVIAQLQMSAKVRDKAGYRKFAEMVNNQSRQLCTLRGLFEFKAECAPVPLEEVEPWTEIVKRFKTGAMSYGSISREAHETLAVAMNRIGGKSNSGEGGEEAHRYVPDANGDSRSSAIKQVASGRFGVTSFYLVNAKEIQIKMAQGAKPGEGGQLPGEKVDPAIAKARHSTPFVGLVSPPPHHDIYSIEDLAQLIHDLKNANRNARINVKLVSEVGVGTVAAGVAKGKADVVLISGWDGGTGASPETSLKHAGLPWELGLAEAHQTLVQNNLRSRIVVETDGKLMTGRDVAVAALLGAEEFGFSTAPLVVMGCIMMRVCHLNTCPVGIATQNAELRKKFKGQPDDVINYFFLVAEELREIMASLGFRTLNEMIGQRQCLDTRAAIDHYKARKVDLSRVLHKPEVPASYGLYCQQAQDHGLDQALDNQLIRLCRNALDGCIPVKLELPIHNVNRTVGAMLSAEISRRYGEKGLPEANTIRIKFRGSAGQSFGAFGCYGLTFFLEGDANDYFGKGLCGARLSVFPPANSSFKPEENVIIGNVAFYGATSGKAYIRGRAGERFCVRNSGVETVVEGVGDHGCEYMTGGRVVVLGPTGRNFAAGMSGGIAYVLDESGDFEEKRCNTELVELERVEALADREELWQLIDEHYHHTGSTVAKRILDNWSEYLSQFVKVMPVDYRKALQKLADQKKSAMEAWNYYSQEAVQKQM
jgi:glutamate synthase domain-containing protein 2/glutamate synthase domain-containing protein 1/glutamate synthase domain-containing protein 3